MKALTIRQPWASLIAAGVKTIETRSWSPRYRGPLLIHAGKARFGFSSERAEVIRSLPLARWGDMRAHVKGDPEMCDNYPLGAVVAVADLVDVVPIIDDTTGPRTVEPHFSLAPNCYGYLFPATMPDFGWYPSEDEPVDHGDQLPLGDFTPERYAWLLDNVRRIHPVPSKGKQGLWAPDEELVVGVEDMLAVAR